jgi:hypothetical protein
LTVKVFETVLPKEKRKICVGVADAATLGCQTSLCLITVVIFINDSLQSRLYANEIINVSSSIHHRSGRERENKPPEYARFAGKRERERDNHYGQQAIYFYAPWPKYYSGEWRRRCVSIGRKSAFSDFSQTKQGAIPFRLSRPFFPLLSLLSDCI